jgi:hypothetical protein
MKRLIKEEGRRGENEGREKGRRRRRGEGEK